LSSAATWRCGWANVEYGRHRLGRHLVANPDRVGRVLNAIEPCPSPAHTLPDSLRQRIDALDLDASTTTTVAHLTADLVAYHDAPYASEFQDVVEQAWRTERAVVAESSALTVAVAHGLYRLMANKDEYEVARLLLDDEARRDIERVGRGRVRNHLHPPYSAPSASRAKSRSEGGSIRSCDSLHAERRLRGTVLDPFRWPQVRRTERQLPGEYRAAIERILPLVDRESLPAAVAIAELPDIVRGYEKPEIAAGRRVPASPRQPSRTVRRIEAVEPASYVRGTVPASHP
jgi:indolepyruvate ferredoxin oxidoreductase